MGRDRLVRSYSRETLTAQPSAIRDICVLVARRLVFPSPVSSGLRTRHGLAGQKS